MVNHLLLRLDVALLRSGGVSYFASGVLTGNFPKYIVAKTMETLMDSYIEESAKS